ncbi:hypothetical protein FOYG_16063 [Fusarium oxysporum NRRL 32931]|uniref:PNPLA domain-containing protein n=1 Tax=Fusarium oxysporum NRRL 32931 TaxID=660029 RepID=W9HLR7_FUSOX|nr:hypothetical protein FOYG_16063 [Fusarium oxysporum NRRL 32931]
MAPSLTDERYPRQPARAPPPVPQPPPNQPSYKPCHQCHANTKTFICIQCNNLTFCDICWSTWVLHADGATGWGGRPHEKSDPHVITRLRGILEPNTSDADHEKSLELDDDTTWFGVVRDPSQQQVFQDYGRFAALMSESQSEESEDRFPQLVSFIGQTGAGKSTLIKILIERAQAESITKLPSPVTSSANDRLATTGDVHLYGEPSSFHSTTPILFADCEGLNGGERIPRGLKHRTFSRDDVSGIRPTLRPLLHVESKAKLKKSRYSSQRNILWASTPATKKREFSVTQLYPRLLYTFSDVVVFVLRNPRAFESTLLEQILGWGAASMDKSVNQPTLPHAVIVLNATEDVDDKEWDIKMATELLMDDVRSAVRQVPQVEEYARIWKQRGRNISSTHDLLKCYYASVSVVRVPARGRYMLMDEQIEKLFKLIRRKCEASLLNKKRLRMLATAEKLQIYLQAAFDHFAQNLTVPFDFIKEALKHNPVPRDLGGNILKLALFMQENSPDQPHCNAAHVFTTMSPMLASCFHLDSVRQNLLGTTDRLLSDVYIEFCEYAIKVFSDIYLPCEFENSRGKCCNRRLGHSPKGHQNEFGKIIAPGSYQSSFQRQQILEEWLASIRCHLQDIEAKFDEQTHQYSHLSNATIAADMHLQEINRFYSTIGGASNFLSHETCLACLRELPEHALPCGHILCNPCVLAHGKKISLTAIVLEKCPLHYTETFWEPPWQINVKPPHAGVRILCLDGGGFRGIISLLVLRHIEKYLSPELPIQSFFDLIVGTSTGGIISLGLGVNNWTVDDCIQTFRELCHRAFTPREMKGVPVLEQLAVIGHGSMYKTKPFEELLKEKFDQNRPLFGGSLGEGPDEPGEMATKVAVTSTISVDQHAVVISNYNRPENPMFSTPYRFQRAPQPDREMKVWEAARATAAAPPYFKPYEKPETKEMYIDGALYHNCPVWVAHHEKRLIWGDVSGRLPDLLVSVGTGFHKHDSTGDPAGRLSPHHKQQAGKQSLITQLYKTGSGRLGDILNCNRIWESFLTENSQLHGRSIPDGEQRYIRINPDLGENVPRLDDVSMMEEVERKTSRYLKQNRELVKETAHRLIASTFFFETDPSRIKHVGNGFRCQGRILCKFVDRSDDLKALGRFLQAQVSGSFEPYFTIQEQGYPSNEITVLLSEDTINTMCVRGNFELDVIEFRANKEFSPIHMSLCLEDNSSSGSSNRSFPISGFPRELVDEHRKPGPPRPPVNSGLRRDSSGRRRFWNNRPMHNQGSIDEHGLDALSNLTLSQRLTDLQSGSNMFNVSPSETEQVYELEG